MTRIRWSSTLLLVLLGFAQPVIADVTALERAVVDAIAEAENSVVAVSRTTAPARREALLPGGGADRFLLELQNAQRPSRQANLAVGAGVIIDKSGLILTQYLFVSEGDQHFVTTTAGQQLPARIKAADPRSGLAILEVEQNDLPAIKVANADKLMKGQLVVAIGNPHAIISDGEPSASWGIISNLAQKIGADINFNDTAHPRSGSYATTLHHLGTLIQTDAKLTFGSGGGALVNLQGEMVGLSTSIATIAGHEKPAGYAIPMNSTFRRIIESLKDGEEVEYGLLGISLGMDYPLGLNASEGSVLALEVVPGGPAARSGIERQDRITKVNDRPVRSPEELQLVIGSLAPATKVQVAYLRDGTPGETEVKLAKFPAPGKFIATTKPPAWRGIRVDYSTMRDVVAARADAVRSKVDPQGCVIIRDVEQGSSSWKSGVRPGMYISHVGKTKVSTPQEFYDTVAEAGGVVDVRLTEPLAEEAETEKEDEMAPLEL